MTSAGFLSFQRILWRRFLTALCISTFVLGPLQAATDHGAELDSQLTAVTDSTSLLGVSRPWHLKAEATLYGQGDAVADTVSFERWQSGENSRTVQTYHGVEQVSVERDGKSYRELNSQPVPQKARMLLESVLHPGPSQDQRTGTDVELRPTNLGTTKLECLMLSRKMTAIVDAPVGLFPSYCLSQTSHLVLIYHFGGQVLLRGKVATFLGHEITMGASLFQGQTLLGKVSVTELGTFVPQNEEFQKDKGLVEVGTTVTISGGVLAKQKITGSVPVYPEQDRMNRVSGTVVLQVLIGTDGRIYV